VLLSVLVGASIGAWVGGIFGGFVAALLSIPAAGAVQVIVVEIWRLTGPPRAAEIDAITPAGTVVAVEKTETIEGVEVTVDEAGPQPDSEPEPEPDSAAPAEGGHQRP
jgi:hypothetical protein